MDGAPLKIDTPAGSRIFFGGRELYPSPPLATAVNKALSIPLSAGTLYILCSPLLWYGVAELAARLPAHATLILLELDPALHGLCDWAAEFNKLPQKLRVHPIGPCTHEQALSRIIDAFSRGTRRIQSLGLNAGRMLHQERYRLMCETAEQELRRFWRNRSTLLYMGRLWTRNLISNLSDENPAQDIRFHPRHRNVVVIGAGPSLDARMDLLSRYRAELFLVAVDTALPTLFRRGIKPDLVVVLESQWANIPDFIPGGLDYPAVAYDLSSSPLVHRHFRFGHTWTFVSDYAPGAHWDSLRDCGWSGTRIPALGSVGVAAMYLSRFICSGHVHIIGLDFAWHTGASHAVDSPSRLAQLQRNHRLSHQDGETTSLRKETVSVPDVHGRPIHSDATLLSYRDSLNEVIKVLGEQGLQVHDLRRSGLPLIAPVIEDAEFIALVRSSEARDADPHQISKPFPENEAAGKMWIRALHEQIGRCSDVISDYLKHRIGSSELPRIDASSPQGEEILAMLDALDFLFLDVADIEWPSLDPGALTRALIILDYYKGFILQRS